MKKRILAFLQSIIDRHTIKQLQGKFHSYGAMYYGSEYVDCNEIPFVYYNMYTAFDIVFRKVYGANKRELIQGLRFSFNPSSFRWTILLTTPRPGFIIGKKALLIEETEKKFKDLFGVEIEIELEEQKKRFHEEY